MYKFANGLVCFTEEDKENYIKAGLKLVEDKKEVDNVKENDNVGTIETKYRGNTKKSGKISKSVR